MFTKYTKMVLSVIIFITSTFILNAQISGVVYRDYNGNGTQQIIAPANEYGVEGIIINAYSNENVLVATTVSAADGSYTLPYAVPVRVEFVIPATGTCISNTEDQTGFSGDGNNIRFVTTSTSIQNYAIQSPAEYQADTDPFVFIPIFTQGDPLGGGTAGSSTGATAYKYSSTATPTSQLTAGQAATGSVWGSCYSRQAKKIFTSSFVKRQVGLGPLGSGGIYMLEPTGATFNVTNFYDLDANGYRTRALSTAVAFGNGSSYAINGDTIVTYLGTTDPESGAPEGLGVIGSNVDRGLPALMNVDCYDPAAFDQTCKVGLGDIEISDDGKFLFVMNLYSRKMYRLELDNAYNPTTVIGVTSYSMPTVAVSNGLLRPFAISYYRGKVYVGAVTTGENGGTNIVNGATDLYAYVFEMNNPTGTATINASPVMSFPLNYQKGYPILGLNNTQEKAWHPWTNNTNNVFGVGEFTWSSPVLSNIDFTDRGAMVLDFFDRGGHQFSYNNFKNLSTLTNVSYYDVSGDVLIAGKDCGTGAYTLENNASYTSGGVTYTSPGVNNTEGPGNGEFFYLEIPPDNYHHETSQGSVAILPGTNSGIFALMDASSAFSGGTAVFSTADGNATNRTLLYNSADGTFSKANGLGDMELIGDAAPIEIGNRVWFDVNKNGIQDANENGIANVTLELCADFDNDGIADGPALATVTTDATGVWYFNNTNVMDGNPTIAGNQTGLQPFKTYLVKVASSDWTAGNGVSELLGLQPTTANAPTVGIADASDNDAILMASIPQITVTTGGEGNNNHSLDFGFIYKPAQLGNYVWNDINKDGIQNSNEVGVAGIVVTLFNATNQIEGTTVTDAYGYYIFKPLDPGTYTVGFTLPANYVFTSQNATTDAIDSDVLPATGKTASYTIVAGDSNMTVDAGIYFQEPTTATVGNYVWYDTNNDGVQDATEQGISGVTVTLYNTLGNAVATTITDANGNYLFTNVAPGNYTIGLTPLPGLTLSPNNGSILSATNSDINPVTGKTSTFTVAAGDNITYVDAGMYSLPTNVGGLGDKVWYDTDNDGIQDATETGVANVDVTLYASNGLTVLATTKTDAFGNYIFNNLPAGQYVVGFSNIPSGFVYSNANQGTDSTLNSDANTVSGKTAIISLALGQFNMTYDAGIHNTNPLNNNSIGDKVWNDVDKNGIQDATEQGVAGITVKLYDNTNTLIASTTTDANGNYLFPNLPNGVYYVNFSNLPAGYSFSPTGAGTTNTDSDPNPSTGSTPTVSLTGNTHITNLDAGINFGNSTIGLASLGDKVWYDMNGNGLQDATEAGVPGVIATLYASDGVTVLKTTTTDALGNYIFTGLAAGDYIVGFSNIPSGFTITTKNTDGNGISGERNSDVNTGTMQTDIVKLGVGEDKLFVDMGIVPPVGTASLGDKVWFDLNNNGLQDAGEPGVQGITVSLLDITNTVIAVTTTDINGEYHFVGLAPDTYSVQFSNVPSGYIFTTENIDALGINGTGNSDANVSTGKTASVTLALGENNPNLDAGIVSTTVGSVGDYVWYDKNGNGIQDAGEAGISGILVTLYDNTGTPVASTITNPDGSYIFTNVTPGTYTMGFTNIPSSLQFTEQETNPTGNTGSNVNPILGITPSFVISAGTHTPSIDAGLKTPVTGGIGNYVWHDINVNGIQDAGETPIAGVIVTLYAADGVTVIATTVTDGNGAYSFTELPDGSYIVGFSNFPAGYVPTLAIGTLGTTNNSDINGSGKTGLITITGGAFIPNVDAGLFIGVPLPIQLKEFTANENNCNVDIAWTVTSEQGVEKYNVLRKGVTSDKFVKIATLNAIGNTNTDRTYTYTDVAPINGAYEYKIQVQDMDAKISETYTKSVTVACTSNTIGIYPNPSSDVLYISFGTVANTSDVSIQLLDVAGKTVLVKNTTISTSITTEKINVSSLAKGIYILKIINGETNFVKQIEIVR